MQNVKENWWMLALRGVLLGLLSIIIFAFSKEEPLVKLFVYWGVLMMLVGLVTGYYAYKRYEEGMPYVFPALLAVLDLALSGFIFGYTDQVVRIFQIIVGSWAIGLGFVLIYMALKSEGQKWLLQINGLVSLALGVIIILDPFGDDRVWNQYLLGIYGLLLAGWLVLLSLRIRVKTTEVKSAKDVPLELEQTFNDDGGDEAEL